MRKRVQYWADHPKAAFPKDMLKFDELRPSEHNFQAKRVVYSKDVKNLDTSKSRNMTTGLVSFEKAE